MSVRPQTVMLQSTSQFEGRRSESGGLTRTAWLFETLFLIALVGVLFALHTRWIYTHFSHEGYLLDAGWIAHLFGSGDPLITNPSAISALSFHAHHLSPHIFLFGAPFVWLFKRDGIAVFAYHQGVFFAMFAVAAWLLATAAPVRYPVRAVLLASALLIGAVGNALFQAAGYPHYEIAMIAVTALALAAGVRGYWRLFVACLVWLPLIREDGGFFAAFVCLACIAVRWSPGAEADAGGRQIRFFAAAAAIEMIVSLCAFVVKAAFFPGFDAFSGNFSGDNWSHFTRALIVERVMSAITNPTIAPALAGSVLLALRDPRYAAALLLLSPLYAIHILSVRAEHGNFTLYYALPWLLPPIAWLGVFAIRTTRGRAHVAEAAVILLASLALAAPVHAALRLPRQFWYVAEWSFTRPVANLASMKQFVPWAITHYGKSDEACVSQGIAALLPNDFTPRQVVNPSSDLAKCRPLLLLRADLDYGPLTSNAGRIGFARAGARQNAEMWLPSGR